MLDRPADVKGYPALSVNSLEAVEQRRHAVVRQRAQDLELRFEHAFVVEHSLHGEPGGWRCWSGFAAVARRQRIGDAAERSAPEGDVCRCADEIAHHFAKKSVADEVDLPPFGVACVDTELGEIEGAVKGFDGRAAPTKAFEIMRADHLRQRRCEMRAIHRLRNVGEIAVAQRRRRLPVIDAIAVPLSDGTLTCMESCIHNLGVVHHKARRQRAIQRVAQPLRGNAAVKAEMCHLRARVHASVCASGAVDVHRSAEKLGDGLLEQALHGDERFVALALEACKTGAVVAHGQFVGGHRISSRPNKKNE